MISQDLNESRFLVEELNLDDEPTEEQILDRAEELDIPDLQLARESLTKSIDPEWRPYYNRYRKVYYINLQERKAYIDHPIDMEFKILYARKNSLSIPKFRSLPVEQVSKSLHLIEQQIELYRHSVKKDLNIVYEEPSEENQSSRINLETEREEELSPEQIEELLRYEQQLQIQYRNQYLKQEMDYFEKIKNINSTFEQFEAKLKNHAQQSFGTQFQQQTKAKNEADFLRQKQKTENQFSERKIAYTERLTELSSLENQLMIKKYRISQLAEERDKLKQIQKIQSWRLDIQLARQERIQSCLINLESWFSEKVDIVTRGSRQIQKKLQNQLQQLSKSLFKRRPIFRKAENQKKISTNIQAQFKNRQRNREQVYEQLFSQIENEKVWTKYDITNSPQKIRKPHVTSKLWMRVV